MSDTHKSTRLGDLLIERGAITRQQLAQAIEVQQERRLQDVQNNRPISKQSELGEVLIDLGFINRRQLDSGLTWQRRLRKTTMVMAFIAPLLTAACGGGGGASASTGTGSTQTNPAATQVVNSPKPSDPQAGAASSSAQNASSTPSKATSSNAQQTSSAPSITPKPKPANNSSSSSASFSGEVNGPVEILWVTPQFRENGDYLEFDEIGGFELRYKLKSEETYTTIFLEPDVDEYLFDHLEGDYEFEIATFDTEGLYSKYVAINPST